MAPSATPPWVPTFAPTYPPTQHWYESKIKLQARYIEESHVDKLKLENEVAELGEEVVLVKRHARELARENKVLEGRVRALRGGGGAMRGVGKEVDVDVNVERRGRLRQLVAERKGRRLERENRMLKEKIELLEARLTREGRVVDREGDYVDVEDSGQDGGDEDLEGGGEVGFPDSFGRR